MKTENLGAQFSRAQLIDQVANDLFVHLEHNRNVHRLGRHELAEVLEDLVAWYRDLVVTLPPPARQAVQLNGKGGVQ